MTLLQKLEAFYAKLPVKYFLTELNMYTHKDQHILSAVISLHLFFHAALCDLTRISLPGFNFPLAVGFQRAPMDFTVQCQERCLFHAREISIIVARARPHAPLAFDDGFVADAVTESTKIHIVCAATNLGNIASGPDAATTIYNNLDILKMLSLGKPRPSPFVSDTPSRHPTAKHSRAKSVAGPRPTVALCCFRIPGPCAAVEPN
jgi:hypothetical protein